MDKETAYKSMIKILDDNEIEYKVIEHPGTVTYEQLEAARAEHGVEGTEAKVLVLQADKSFVVYVTIQGKMLDLLKIKDAAGADRLGYATGKQLEYFFGAEAGCAYPFGFDDTIPVYVDPVIFEQDWLVLSPVEATRTIQMSTKNLQQAFESIDNKVQIIALNE